ncbi:DUF6282 family protein [Patescibacteria group bacterium]|nr:DUF6282 family protein [Patescibacteria group bacterium]
MTDIDKRIQNIVRQSIDLHVHIGPEIVPRKFTVSQLVQAEKGSIGGFALKNHFWSTVPFVREAQTKDIRLVGSVVLNSFVGGLNPDAIYAARTLTEVPFIVWFPTVSASQFLQSSAWEIAPEWIDPKVNVKVRKSQDIPGISVLSSDGTLTKQAAACLLAIKKAGAILATGHISWKEARSLTNRAFILGIKKIILTHPIYQKIAMPVAVQKTLAQKGAFVEFCYSMYSIDTIPIAAIVRDMRTIGPARCIVSSDVGQTFSPSPSRALTRFASLLQKEGISSEELSVMMVKNPRYLTDS